MFLYEYLLTKRHFDTEHGQTVLIESKPVIGFKIPIRDSAKNLFSHMEWKGWMVGFGE